MKTDNPHAGHRERLRSRAKADPGLDTFSDHEVLELLLFYSIPRADTNALAHRLIDAFGSLRGVFEASPAELEAVEGIGENSALLLSLIPSVTRKYLLSRAVKGVSLSSTALLGEALMPYFVGKREETIYVLFLDQNRRTISCDFIGEGSVNAVSLNVAKILRLASLRRAQFAVIAHNHTNGFANPSEQDIITTKRLQSLLASAGVKLLDHLIISDPLDSSSDVCEYVSLAESGVFCVP